MSTLDSRIFRRLAPWLAHAADEQPSDEASAAVSEAVLAGRLGLAFEHDPLDEVCWLALYALDPRFGTNAFLLHLDARNVGLRTQNGRLFYLPDPLLDDDLPGEPIPM